MQALRRPDPVTLAVLALMLLALVLRLVDLGERAMHHDESLHAMYSWYLAEGQGYRHDPLTHGPLQFHVLAFLFIVFGDSDAMSRVFSALAGTALVGTPLLLRRWLGGPGVVVAAALLTFSPMLLYYSRFARNDVPVALFTALMVIATWRYRDDGKVIWLALLAAMLALHFAAKETVYLVAAVMLLYLNASFATTLLRRLEATRRERFDWTERVPAWVFLATVAWAIAALWPLLGRWREHVDVGDERPRDADLLVVVGTLTAFMLSAAVQFPLELLGFEVAAGAEGRAALGTFAVIAVAGAVVGSLWHWRWWWLCAAIFFVISVPLYTTMFSNPNGLLSGFWGSLDYWIAQQEVQRGGQPWYYYLMLLPLYELVALVPAVAGFAWLLRRGAYEVRGLTLLLGWWFLGTLVALSAAGEKMPWLTTHLALPLALLAALVLGRALTHVPRLIERRQRPSGRDYAAWAGTGAATAVMVVLVALTLRTGTGVAFSHPDTPVEPMIYTQTSPDVPRLARQIIAAAEREGEPARPVVIDTTGSLSWPWAWYLRGQPVIYTPADFIRRGEVAEDSILVAARGTVAADHELRERYANPILYRHRWWFPEDGYRGVTAGEVLRGVAGGSMIAEWIVFVRDRVDERELGSFDGEVYFPLQESASAR